MSKHKNKLALPPWFCFVLGTGDPELGKWNLGNTHV